MQERPRQDTLLERVRDVKQWKTTQQERLVQERDTRAQRNKQILKWHERMSRTHHKAKDDDRTRRMDALKVQHYYDRFSNPNTTSGFRVLAAALIH